MEQFRGDAPQPAHYRVGTAMMSSNGLVLVVGVQSAPHHEGVTHVECLDSYGWLDVYESDILQTALLTLTPDEAEWYAETIEFMQDLYRRMTDA